MPNLQDSPTVAWNATGGVLTGASGRVRLTADLDLYVATTGSDSNDGLTVGAPFLTIQKAVDVACQDYDMAGYSITINIADGTYAETVLLDTPVGGGALNILGNLVTPANVVIDPASGRAFDKVSAAMLTGGSYSIKGVKMVATGSQCIWIRSGYVEMSNVEFGAASHHVICERAGAVVRMAGPYTVSAGADVHMWAREQGNIVFEGTFTITFTGSPAWAAYGWYLQSNALLSNLATITNSGTVTGPRYRVESNSLLNGASTAPGSVAGTSATSGVVI